MAKYLGKNTVITWTVSGTTTDLSGSSRSFEIDESGSTVDVTTRDSTTKEELTDDLLTERSVKLSGLDTSGAAPDWDSTDLEIGDSGTISWYPEGNTTGKRKRSATARVKSRKFGSPYDGAATWEIDWVLTSNITKSLVS